MVRAIALFLLWSIPRWASSFELTVDFAEGHYWASLPISLSLYDDGSLESPVLEALEEALLEGIRRWEMATGILGIWRYDGVTSSKSGNVVYWSRNFQVESGLKGSNVLGATIRRTRVPYIQETNILLNNKYFSLNQAELIQVIVHELGHTVGLDHSSDQNAIMAASLRFGDSRQNINSDDQAGFTWVIKEMENRQNGTSNDPNFTKLTQSVNGSSGGGIPSCGTVQDSSDISGPENNFFSILVSLLLGMLLFPSFLVTNALGKRLLPLKLS